MLLLHDSTNAMSGGDEFSFMKFDFSFASWMEGAFGDFEDVTHC
ncbi:hypothetical protein [Paenibacillus amylolyticus]|nr:hypothetical protein [Paenibacillus amylolyticus]